MKKAGDIDVEGAKPELTRKERFDPFYGGIYRYLGYRFNVVWVL